MTDTTIPKRAVIFDMDGTIVDNMAFHTRSWLTFFQQRGHELAADVKHGKPHPDVFPEAARRIDVAPEHCIVFEDAPLGVEAARRAGMRALVPTTTLPACAFAPFDNVICIADDFNDMRCAALFSAPA